MTYFVNTHTNKLVESATFAAPVDSLVFKRGDSPVSMITFLDADGNTVWFDDPDIRVAIKQGFDTDALAYSNTWTSGDGGYTGQLNLATTELSGALGTSESICTNFEITYAPDQNDWRSTQTVEAIVHKDVISLNEELTTAIPSVNDIYTQAETDALLDDKLDATGKAVDSELLDGLDSTYFYPASNPSGFISSETDSQTLSYTDGDLTISNGNTVSLSDTVKTTGDQTIGGTKTFSSDAIFNSTVYADVIGDNLATYTIYMLSAELLDSNGFPVLNWNNKLLKDSMNTNALSWDSRALYDSVGSEVLNWSLGNVGIGTDTPATELDVVGTGTFKTLAIYDAAVPEDYLYFESGSNYLMFEKGGQEFQLSNFLRLPDDKGFIVGDGWDGTLSSDGTDVWLQGNGVNDLKFANFVNYSFEDGDAYFEGNVGIGTGTPSVELDVNGTVRAGQFQVLDGDGITFGSSDDAVIYYDGSNLFIESQLVGTGDLVLNGNLGNVGIGTDSPTRNLTVQGTGGPQFRIEDDDSADWAEFEVNSAGTLYIEPASNDVIVSSAHFTADYGVWARATRGEMGFDGATTYMGLYTNGTEKVRIDTNGNVGIGTDSPDRALRIEGVSDGGLVKLLKLHNAANTAGSSVGIAMGSSSTTVGYEPVVLKADRVGSPLGQSTNFSISVDAGITYPFLIDPAGNVGIGTDTPTYKLDVVFPDDTYTGGVTFRNSDGAVKIRNTTSTAGAFGPVVEGFPKVASQQFTLNGVIQSTEDTGTVPALNFKAQLHNNTAVATRPVFGWSNYGTRLMTMLANGNVGIGTATPSAPLEVKGAFAAFDGIAAHLLVNSDSNGYPSIVLADNASAVWAIRSQNASDNDLAILGKDSLNSWNQYLTIDRQNGNVGIGTSTPAAKLDVNGSIHANGSDVQTQVKGISTVTGSSYSLVANDAGQHLRFTYSGDVTVTVDDGIFGQKDIVTLKNATSGNLLTVAEGTNVTIDSPGFDIPDKSVGQVLCYDDTSGDSKFDLIGGEV